MSIFRNRSQNRPPHPRSSDSDNLHEPRLFSGHQPQTDSDWEYRDSPQESHFQKTQIHRYPAEPAQPPHPSHPRMQGPEDRHPRELSFWQEDRFYEERSSSRFGSPLRFVLVIASLIVIITFAWLSIRWVSTSHETSPPVLYAEPGPYKIRPDHPGGLQVPHQDRLVYNRISPNTSQQPPEQLLPAPEQPMAPAPQQPPMEMQQPLPHQGLQPQAYPQQQAYAPAQGQPVQQSQQQAYANYPSQTQTLTQQGARPPLQQQASLPPRNVTAPAYAPPSGQPMAPHQTTQQQIGQQYPQQYPIQNPSSDRGAPAPQPSPYTHADHQPQAHSSIDELIEEDIRGKAPLPPHKTSERAVTSSQTLSNKTYRIQVATLRNKETAQNELTRIQRSYPDLVGKMISQVDKFNNNGIYRILFGPFSKKENAQARCGKFRAQGFSCIVLNPSP